MKVEKTKRQIQREEERKEAKKQPSQKYLVFTRQLYQYHDNDVINELVALFGAREPTPAQLAAGVNYGKYLAVEYNKACESLAVKAGIRVRKSDDEVDLEEANDEQEI